MHHLAWFSFNSVFKIVANLWICQSFNFLIILVNYYNNVLFLLNHLPFLWKYIMKSYENCQHFAPPWITHIVLTPHFWCTLYILFTPQWAFCLTTIVQVHIYANQEHKSSCSVLSPHSKYTPRLKTEMLVHKMPCWRIKCHLIYIIDLS